MVDDSICADSQSQRKYINRRRVLKGLGASGIAGIAGCNSSSGSSDTITVDYWMYFGGGDAEEMEHLVDKFNEEHTDIQINRQRVPFDQMIDKLYTAVSSGNAPDLASMFMGYAGVMEELAAPIGDYIQDETRNAYMDIPWDYAHYNDKLLCLPIDVHGHALYANEDILAEVGAETPFTSWDEFSDVCNRIKEETDVRPFAFDDDMGATDFSRNFFMAVKQNGGEFLSDDYKNVEFDGEHGLNVANMVSDISGDLGWDNASIASEGERTEAFRRGDLAMMIGGNWDINNLQNEEGDIIEGLNFSFTEPFFFPGDGDDITFTESNSLYVPKNPNRSEEEMEAAVRVAEWITQNNPSWGYDAGHIPAATSVAQSDEVQNSELWQDHGTISTIWDMVSEGKGAYMPQAKVKMLSADLWDWSMDIYAQNLGPEEGLQQGVETVQSALDDAYSG